jgi:hypothetical protein
VYQSSSDILGLWWLQESFREESAALEMLLLAKQFLKVREKFGKEIRSLPAPPYLNFQYYEISKSFLYKLALDILL